MDTNILMQFTDLKKEIDEIENRIERLQKKLRRIQTDGNIKDVVKGGDGGIQTFHINGYPVADEEETQYLISKNVRSLRERKLRVEELITCIEEYVNTLDDSRMRRMITMRYIEGKTWIQVAQRMGRQYTEDSCKKQMERFLKNK